LARVRDLLFSGFEAAKSGGEGGSQPWRRSDQVLQIILFGSYARGAWVDGPENGYQADFDLLVVVSHEKLTNIADYWWHAEDEILRDPAIGRTVNIIVHELSEVNAALRRGEYFWSDIGALVDALLALLAFAVLRPRSSQAYTEASAAMLTEMDAAQARNENTRAAAERERQKLL
jgi:predicted nucleotidyltransferase